jgi:adenylate cyclase class IV
MIEVELRAFLDESAYTQLLTRFRSEGHDVRPVRQITHYLDSKIDTRIQLSRTSGRCWQKLGHMHDTMRQEIEIPLSRSDANALLQIMKNLGFGVRISWYRERVQFNIGQITVSLDHTIGYGRILEVEILCEAEKAEASRDTLLKFMANLGLTPSPRSELDFAFKEYLSDWSRTFGLSELWLDEEGT